MSSLYKSYKRNYFLGISIFSNKPMVPCLGNIISWHQALLDHEMNIVYTEYEHFEISGIVANLI